MRVAAGFGGFGAQAASGSGFGSGPGPGNLNSKEGGGGAGKESHHGGTQAQGTQGSSLGNLNWNILSGPGPGAGSMSLAGTPRGSGLPGSASVRSASRGHSRTASNSSVITLNPAAALPVEQINLLSDDCTGNSVESL